MKLCEIKMVILQVLKFNWLCTPRHREGQNLKIVHCTLKITRPRFHSPRRTSSCWHRYRDFRENHGPALGSPTYLHTPHFVRRSSSLIRGYSRLKAFSLFRLSYQTLVFRISLTAFTVFGALENRQKWLSPEPAFSFEP